MIKDEAFTGAYEVLELVLDGTVGIPNDLLERGRRLEKALDHSLEERFLAPEVVVHGALGGPRQLGDPVHAGALVSLIPKGRDGRLEDGVVLDVNA